MQKRSISKIIRAHSENLWNYCCIPKKSNKAGFMVVFGCQDVGVPRHAAHLLERDRAPTAIISGNKGIITKGHDMRSEAFYFKAIITKTVDEDRIITEEKAEESIENIRLSRLELGRPRHKFIDLTYGIAVTKPYATRRILAIVQKQWESVDWAVECEETSYKKYCEQDERYEELTMHFLVGEISRISKHGGSDYVEQAIPDNVWRSYYELRHEGFDIDGQIAKEENNLALSRRDWLSELAVKRLKQAASS